MDYYVIYPNSIYWEIRSQVLNDYFEVKPVWAIKYSESLRYAVGQKDIPNSIILAYPRMQDICDESLDGPACQNDAGGKKGPDVQHN